MRMGYVRGQIVLSMCVPEMKDKRLVLVEPISSENLAARNGLGGGKTLVAVDHLAAAEGQIVGIVEGREAANPYWPGDVPVDAYCSLIAQNIVYEPLADEPRHGPEVQR